MLNIGDKTLECLAAQVERPKGMNKPVVAGGREECPHPRLLDMAQSLERFGIDKRRKEGTRNADITVDVILDDLNVVVITHNGPIFATNEAGHVVGENANPYHYESWHGQEALMRVVGLKLAHGGGLGGAGQCILDLFAEAIVV